MRKPEQVRQSVMAKLKTHGKGIVLLHDFQHATAEGAMDLLNELAGGYKVVFMKPKFAVTTIPLREDDPQASEGLPVGGGAGVERRAHDQRVARSRRSSGRDRAERRAGWALPRISAALATSRPRGEPNERLHL